MGTTHTSREAIGNFTWSLFLIADALFISQHWVFCSEYLVCASTIRLVFSFDGESNEEKNNVLKSLNSRYLKLRILDVLMYGSIWVLVFLMIFLKVNDNAILLFFDSYTFILTGFFGWSLYRVNKYQKEISGVFANEYLMLIHLSCFLYICMFFFIQDVWFFTNKIIGYEADSDQE